MSTPLAATTASPTAPTMPSKVTQRVTFRISFMGIRRQWLSHAVTLSGTRWGALSPLNTLEVLAP